MDGKAEIQEEFQRQLAGLPESSSVCKFCEGSYWSNVLELQTGEILKGKHRYLEFMNSEIWIREREPLGFGILVKRFYVEPCPECHRDRNMERVEEFGLRINDQVVGLETIKKYCNWNLNLAGKKKFHELMVASFLFWGNTGAGKTTLARCYHNMVLYEFPKKTVVWIDERSLMKGFESLAQVKNGRGDTRDTADILYDKLRDADVLFIDEILEKINWQNNDGMGFMRSRGYRYYLDLINYRYDNRHLITVATSMKLPDKKVVGEDHIQRRLDELFVKKIELKK